MSVDRSNSRELEFSQELPVNLPFPQKKFLTKVRKAAKEKVETLKDADIRRMKLFNDKLEYLLKKNPDAM